MQSVEEEVSMFLARVPAGRRTPMTLNKYRNFEKDVLFNLRVYVRYLWDMQTRYGQEAVGSN